MVKKPATPMDQKNEKPRNSRKQRSVASFVRQTPTMAAQLFSGEPMSLHDAQRTLMAIGDPPLPLREDREGAKSEILSLGVDWDLYWKTGAKVCDHGEGVWSVLFNGTLTSNCYWMGTTYESVLGACEALGAREDVKKVLCRLDTPGGAVAGAMGACDALLRLSQKKAVYGVVEGRCLSMGMMIGACCGNGLYAASGVEKIGGMGVVSYMLDDSESYREQGLRPVCVSTGGIKSDGMPGVPISAECEANLNQVTQDMGMEARKFLSANFGLSMAKVSELFTGEQWTSGRSIASGHGLLKGVANLQQLASAAYSSTPSDPDDGPEMKSRELPNPNSPSGDPAMAEPVKIVPAPATVAELKTLGCTPEFTVAALTSGLSLADASMQWRDAQMTKAQTALDASLAEIAELKKALATATTAAKAPDGPTAPATPAAGVTLEAASAPSTMTAPVMRLATSNDGKPMAASIEGMAPSPLREYLHGVASTRGFSTRAETLAWARQNEPTKLHAANMACAKQDTQQFGAAVHNAPDPGNVTTITTAAGA